MDKFIEIGGRFYQAVAESEIPADISPRRISHRRISSIGISSMGVTPVSVDAANAQQLPEDDFDYDIDDDFDDDTYVDSLIDPMDGFFPDCDIPESYFDSFEEPEGRVEHAIRTGLIDVDKLSLDASNFNELVHDAIDKALLAKKFSNTTIWKLSDTVAELLPAIENTSFELRRLQARQHELFFQLFEAVLNDPRVSSSSNLVDGSLRYVQAEVASALNISEWTVANQLNKAHTLAARYPETLDALRCGKISSSHANTIVDAGVIIQDDDCRQIYEQRALEIAFKETPGRLRAQAKLIAEEYAHHSLELRHLEALKTRNVKLFPLEDGISNLVATLDSVTAAGIYDRLRKLVVVARENTKLSSSASSSSSVQFRSVEKDGDSRNLGEVTADIFADLLLSAAVTTTALSADALDKDIPAITPVVRVTIPMLNLIGVKEVSPNAAELDGYGPIDINTAKRLAADAPVWERVLTHPITGIVLAVDRYRPTKSLQRFLRVRDKHCRFPGCRKSASRSDIDHTIDWQYGGKTSPNNTAHLCRRHHSLKHAKFVDGTRWRVEQEENGRLKWVSPQGRKYWDVPQNQLGGKATSLDTIKLGAPPF